MDFYALQKSSGVEGFESDADIVRCGLVIFIHIGCVMVVRGLQDCVDMLIRISNAAPMPPQVVLGDCALVQRRAQEVCCPHCQRSC